MSTPLSSSNTTAASDTNTSQAQNTSGVAANLYGAGQSALQGILPGLFSSLLGGQIPSSFTNPAAPEQAYVSNFQNSIEPGLAAQYGPNSPQIASQESQGLEQLQGSLYNTGVSNYLSALNSGSSTAFTPTGQAASTAGTGTSNTAAAGTSETVNGINQDLLLALLQAQ